MLSNKKSFFQSGGGGEIKVGEGNHPIVVIYPISTDQNCMVVGWLYSNMADA